MAKRKSQLATYRAKRDFSKTAEPSGDLKVAPSKRLRFVVQKHAATRLHYDLRLELDGVFKSWAVTKLPSFDTSVKRLAVEVEDHPLEYGDFEGTIAPGQYGAGTVQLWDRGYWEPEGSHSAQDMLAKGELKFQLDGQRLKGGWVLVRMRNDKYRSKRNNWLLIKHRDAFTRSAGDDLVEEDASVASGRPMAAIAAGKGRRPTPFMLAKQQSFTADAKWDSRRGAKQQVVRTTAAREPAEPKPRRGKKLAKMPSFIAPQLCTLLDRPPEGAGWAHEIKFDGYRIQMRVESGKCVLRTRKGLDWSDKFPEIAAAGKGLPDCLIDGEVVALDRAGAPDFAGLQTALSESRTGQLVYFAFDLLCLDGEDLRSLPLSERKQRLLELLKSGAKGRAAVRYVEHFETGGDALLKSACRMSLEGIVSKKLDAPYHSGRGHAWTKAKCRAGHEVIIGGWSENGGRFRSLLVGVRHDHLVYVGRVGTGFGATTVAQIMPRLKQQASDTNPFKGANAPKDHRDIHWLKPVLVAEIEFAGWTEDGMVRQGSFKGLREDKPAAEVRAELPPTKSTPLATPTPAPAATAAAPRRTRPKNDGRAGVADSSNYVMGLAISNPGKTMWPATAGKPALTKLDLAHYFEKVGPRMIDYVRSRPISLVRAPDGIDGQHFFQRHAMLGMSSLVDTVRVSGDHKPYLRIERPEALVALAQIAALELHPWNSEPGAPDTPGRLVFDLDPASDLQFDKVIEAALELRGRLEDLGLVAFCKTTGGKGLHLVTPLKNAAQNSIGWPEAKLIARTICEQMAADSPRKYLTTMAKKDRTGRIFLDYLRNDRTSTAVGLLSPRARAGAPVSMPVAWSKVTKRLKPMDYTVRTVPRLLERSDPWDDYDKSARPLVKALKKLVAGTRAA